MKNRILKTITAISAALVFAGMCGADSDSLVPYVMMWAGIAWMYLFTLANSPERRQ